MIVHSIKEIIETERRIIISLRVQASYCEGCTVEAISYHEDVIAYMKLLQEKENED